MVDSSLSDIRILPVPKATLSPSPDVIMLVCSHTWSKNTYNIKYNTLIMALPKHTGASKNCKIYLPSHCSGNTMESYQYSCLVHLTHNLIIYFYMYTKDFYIFHSRVIIFYTKHYISHHSQTC